MTTYHLIIDDELRQEIDRLSAEYKRDPNSAAGKEYVGVINGRRHSGRGARTPTKASSSATVRSPTTCGTVQS